MQDNFKNKNLTEIAKTFIENGEAYSRNKRHCNGISDENFLLTGITRVILENASGRDFIQKCRDEGMTDDPTLGENLNVGRSTYFDALSSARREKYVSETCDGIYKTVNNFLSNYNVDYLKEFKELNGRDAFAGDGHYISHAVHTDQIKDKYPNMGTIYMRNLRNGLTVPLCQVESETSSKPHEIPFIRKFLPNFSERISVNAPIMVYDLAVTDKVFWTIVEKARKNRWHVVTLNKSNIKPIFKAPLEFDKDDPVNVGVEGYYLIGLDNAGVMYLVEYTDPETGKHFEFLTTDPSLRPGTVAYLYKIRWKIEKAYDVFKNKLFETKAWATSHTSHKIQSSIIAATYNIIIFLIHYFDVKLGIKEEKLIEKRKKDLNKRETEAKKNGMQIHIFEKFLPYCFQLSQQFIRCFRNHFFKLQPLKRHIPIFAERMQVYI